LAKNAEAVNSSFLVLPRAPRNWLILERELEPLTLVIVAQTAAVESTPIVCARIFGERELRIHPSTVESRETHDA
jgi:hypothetical protein